MAIDMKKLMLRFVDEARDHLGRLGDGVASLERDGAGGSAVDTLFRSAHTLKGSSRMMKLNTFAETAHRMEDLLGSLRDRKVAFAPAHGALLYRAIDTLSGLVDRVAERPDQPDLPALDEGLCEALAEAARGDTSSIPPVSGTAAPPPETWGEISRGPAASPEKTLAEEEQGAMSPAAPAQPAVTAAQTVRIRLGKLDALIKLMGEVVSGHARLRLRLNDLGTLERTGQGEGLSASALRQLGKALREDAQAQMLLMEELRDRTLEMRMLPLSVVFDPIGRTVREMARSLGKQAECVVTGAEIELDRQIIERLSEPVVHLLRNAVDHGIETPERREALGKPPMGRVTVSARQDGRWVVVEVGDDGTGIDTDRVLDKAVRKGLVGREATSGLSREEILDFIFQPGFSTSPIVTDLSGRGVGLDSVKRCVVDELQGTISVDYQLGRGSVFTLRLPLSLASMGILLVEAGGQRFGLVSRYVVSLQRVPRESLLVAAGREVTVLGNEFIPTVALSELTRTPPRPARPGGRQGGQPPGVVLVVIRVRQEKLALAVDGILDERDRVIKPLPDHMLLPLVSGMVVSDRNELVSVLHAPALLDAARRLHRPIDAAAPVQEEARHDRILVVDDSTSTREIEKDLLEAYGYQVTLAEDGIDGLEKALAEPFDAVVTDVEMPGIDGFSLTERLRMQETYRAVPIVIVTSRHREEDKRRGVEAGADAYIVKSDFDQNTLVDTLRILLG